MYSIKDIAIVLNSPVHQLSNPEAVIEHLLIDSRKLVFPESSLFFAIKTSRNNGAFYIEKLYKRGVRNFVIHKEDPQLFSDANYLIVNDPLRSLQQLAAWHRSQFTLPVIGITGSNGKTMVKEWLYQLLQYDYNIVRSPKSYNSQVGVPLSVWQINDKNTLAIFEAGISQPGEMQHLQKIIQPTLGVLTNLGEAHNEGFTGMAQKAAEKMQLFRQVQQFVYCKDCNELLKIDAIAEDRISEQPASIFSWGTLAKADLTIQQTNAKNGYTTINTVITKTATPVQITIPFTDKASIDNAITCWCVMLLLGYSYSVIENKMLALQPLDMRMQLKRGINNCTIINDSYNNDLSSLELALDYLAQQSSGRQTTLILSDIFQSGHSMQELVQTIQSKIRNRHINRLILIGPLFFGAQNYFETSGSLTLDTPRYEFYSDTQAFFQQSNTHHFKNEVILLKGARVFEFEQISHWLEEKVHQTVLEVNLTSLVHNLKEYQQKLLPGTRLMAMVKAFSYGSGSVEIASVLQFHQVDYLAVAYADEGVELRRAGIHMPIIVMNPEIVTFDLLVEHNLEPEMYSVAILIAYIGYLKKQGIPRYPIHIKLDTGMHRLGFDPERLAELTDLLKDNENIAVQSVFSHLAASENPEHDAFTQAQATLFEDCCIKIRSAIGYNFLKHLSNSAAIFRHPKLQYDMVRLGIGLYGIDSTSNTQIRLETVVTLKSTIAQIRHVKKGESIGYNRKGIVTRNSLIATLRIGYADGYSRSLGNGIGQVWIKGNMAAVIGNVCMDMIMVDITDIPGVEEGDEAELFGKHISVEQVAAWSKTIPYEVLTGISQRVKRIYYEE